MNAAKHIPGATDELTQGPWIEIFVAGTHTDASGRKMSFTEEHLDELVASYNPAVHEAPVVVGHPKTDDPALGWIATLKRDGIKLLAQEREVAAEFEDMRERGAYKKRSASFYLPDSPGNPTPGKMHLRHVGWLGAMPPAIKGMADKAKAAAFNEDDGDGVVEFNDMAVATSAPRWILGVIADAFDRMRDNMVEREGSEAADRIMPRWQINSIREAGLMPAPSALPVGFGEGDEEDVSSADAPNPDEDTAMTEKAEEIAAAQQQLATDRAELERQQTEFNESKRVADEAANVAAAEEQRIEATEFAESLVKEGKLLPKYQPALLALYQAAQQIPGPLNFGEGETAGEAPATQIVRDAFSALPKAFDFSEKSGEDGDSLNTKDPAAIAKAATEFREAEHKVGREVSFAQAVNHVTKGAQH